MANTLKFGNGEWYGKKDTILAYNDLNSNYKPLPFNFSRDSKATVVNKDGLIEEVGSGQPRVDYLNNTKGAMLLEPSRTNLITYSEDFPRTYWTKSGATIQGDPSTQGSELVTNGSFTGGSTGWALGSGWAYSSNAINATSTSSVCYQDIATMQSNKTYTVTYQISNYSGGNIQWRFGGTGTVDGATRNANGTYTESFTNSSSGDKRLFLSPSGFTGTIDNVSVKEVQGFTSLDGTNNAYKLVEGTNNGNHSISATVLVNSGNNSFSMYVKENGRKHISLYTNSRGSENDQYGFYLNGSGSVTFNNTNGDATITSLSNGWYRVSITHPSSGYNTRLFKLYLSDSEVSSNAIPSYQGDGLKGVYIYGSQVEAGSYSTSLIKTQGSAVTRLADACNNGANEQVINSTEGVLYAEIAALANDGTNRYISLSDGSSSNRVILRFSTSNRIRIDLVVANVNQFNAETNANANQFYKVAFSYKQNEFKFYVNGVLIGSSTSGNVPLANTLNQLKFQDGSSGSNFYGNVKDVRVYNTALTDQELASLTQV